MVQLVKFVQLNKFCQWLRGHPGWPEDPDWTDPKDRQDNTDSQERTGAVTIVPSPGYSQATIAEPRLGSEADQKKAINTQTRTWSHYPTSLRPFFFFWQFTFFVLNTILAFNVSFLMNHYYSPQASSPSFPKTAVAIQRNHWSSSSSITGGKKIIPIHSLLILIHSAEYVE